MFSKSPESSEKNQEIKHFGEEIEFRDQKDNFFWKIRIIESSKKGESPIIIGAECWKKIKETDKEEKLTMKFEADYESIKKGGVEASIGSRLLLELEHCPEIKKFFRD